jgi:thiamine kinase-like enzyme
MAFRRGLKLKVNISDDIQSNHSSLSIEKKLNSEFKNDKMVTEILSEVVTLLNTLPTRLMVKSDWTKTTRRRGNTDSHIYYDEIHKLFIKQFLFRIGDKLAETNVIREIVLQKYAHALNNECQLFSPNIVACGKFEDSETLTTEIYFAMNAVPDSSSLKDLHDYFEKHKDDCENVAKQITKMIECLTSSKLSHNDLNTGNIFFNKKTKQISLIDFGEARYGGVVGLNSFNDRDTHFMCRNVLGITKKRQSNSKGGRRFYTRRNGK